MNHEPLQEEKGNYYAVIPANVRYDKRLKPLARLLYAEITALSNDKGFCWAKNQYFSKLYEVSKETVSRWISQLEEYGYIRVEISYKNNSKQVDERKISISTPIDKKINTPCQNNQEGIDKKINTPIDKIVKDNITSSNTTINTTDNKRESAKAPHFQKPEKEEVLRVFQENTHDVKLSIAETEKFFDYYDSVGWKIGGKTPMRDWKATVRNWVRRMESYKKPEKSNQGQSKINPVLVCYTWETISDEARRGHKDKQAYIEMWEAIAKRKNQTIKWEVSPWAKQKAE